MAVYLNTYERYQAYGGPEEGGWWYEVGTPLQSILISHQDYIDWYREHDTDEDYEKLKELLEKTTHAYTEGRAPKPIDNGTGGYTFMPGSDIPSGHRMSDDIYSCFEDHYAEDYPEQRPTYC